MSFLSGVEPDAATAAVLARILNRVAPPDPARPWGDQQVRCPVSGADLPLPELGRLVLHRTGFVDGPWFEKQAWRVEGTFDAVNVALASEKFGVRCYVDPSQTDDPAAVGAEFIRTIAKAAKLMDRRVLAPVVDAQIRAANVTLLNQHGRLRGAYEYFRWQAQAFLDGDGDPAVRETLGRLAATAARIEPPSFPGPLFMSSHAEMCLTAMAAAYFSWLEHVLVLMLPFTTTWDPAAKPLTVVIGDRWGEKWKLVFGSTDSTMKPTYDRLSEASEQYRNLNAHGGFGKGHTALLVHTELGALPARLTQGVEAIRASVLPTAAATLPKAGAVFDEADRLLRTGPMSLPMEWIEAGLQVPFDARSRKEFAQAMNSGEQAFRRLLGTAAVAEDRLHNFE